MKFSTDEIASKYLGKKIGGSESYSPDFIVPIPRLENRKQYNIDDKALPFSGVDVWHAYEFSSMTTNGIPVTRLLKLRYSCESEFIVESKSLKLYLNSFNMSRFGETVEECLEVCKRLIEKDLSNALQTDVSVNFLDESVERKNIFTNFENIINYIDQKELKIEKYKEAPELLETETMVEENEHFLYFDSLRSNCRVTHQPDFGDVFIYYKSKKHIKESSLLKYLVSFRSEYHFHEECCEMIYKRLFDLLEADDSLFVCALYTRRGGIDICPVRFSKNCKNYAGDLLDLNIFARKSIKQ